MPVNRDLANPMPVNPDQEFGSGWSQWNLQAWMDFLVVKTMMRRVGDVIPKTYVPILRLVSQDADEVDRAYAEILARREPIRLFDSPRDRWRKRYGAYIRELEWVYGELRQHLPKHQYQDLVVDIMARNIKDAMGPMMASLERSSRDARDVGAAPRNAGRRSSAIARPFRKLLATIGGWVVNHLNPAHAIVGPVEMEFLPDGKLKMYIPRCYMHTAVGDGQTQDQSCLWGCKAACEKVFDSGTVAPMYFEPHLPDFSCTLTVALDRRPATQS